jgi:hypothetical protein
MPRIYLMMPTTRRRNAMVKPELEASDSIEFPHRELKHLPGQRSSRRWRYVMLAVYAAFLACTIVYVVIFVLSLLMVNGRG